MSDRTGAARAAQAPVGPWTRFEPTCKLRTAARAKAGQWVTGELIEFLHLQHGDGGDRDGC